MRGASHGAERVAIVDFDNHRGNGARQIFWSDPSVLYASTHEMRHYPVTSARGEYDTIGQCAFAGKRWQQDVS
jgi:acetoin utilization deacetylase AcuC-like enzyme